MVLDEEGRFGGAVFTTRLPHHFLDAENSPLARRAGASAHLDMLSTPRAYMLQHGEHRHSIIGDGVDDVRVSSLLSLSNEDAVADQVFEVADQHAFRDAGNAAQQFAGAHRLFRKPPEDGSLPSAVDDRQHGVDRALGDFLF